MKEISIYVGR
jgi:hypothetical protein